MLPGYLAPWSSCWEARSWVSWYRVSLGFGSVGKSHDLYGSYWGDYKYFISTAFDSARGYITQSSLSHSLSMLFPLDNEKSQSWSYSGSMIQSLGCPMSCLALEETTPAREREATMRWMDGESLNGLVSLVSFLWGGRQPLAPTTFPLDGVSYPKSSLDHFI